MTLEVPNSITLPGGATAHVKGVTAKLIDGKLVEVVYTIEKSTGAWSEVAAADVDPPAP